MKAVSEKPGNENLVSISGVDESKVMQAITNSDISYIDATIVMNFTKHSNVDAIALPDDFIRDGQIVMQSSDPDLKKSAYVLCSYSRTISCSTR